MDEEIRDVASLHRIELAALVHLEGKGDQAIHRSGSSDGSVLSEAKTTPCSPQSGHHVQGPGLWLEANSNDEPSFSKTVETLKADAAAQECIVELFCHVLDRCIAMGQRTQEKCKASFLKVSI